ncbi:Zinc/iron permease [Ochromonadaceae sp. CCMP2298]|nr:Zinc/iron permease [Ochromonadaceae sp. CCMP2298]|mmetsp:Transcript_22837/g.49420  ORF Transcript_22837/g.49420 Transcript_22837/m.49420 type:complete len:390 (-) Transcript_22837:306-1475(-)
MLDASSHLHAYMAIGLISLLPNLLLIFIPSGMLVQKPGKINVQNIFLSFAAAGLMGDVFLHTLPHLLAPHSHGDHGHSEHEEHAEHHDHHNHADADRGGSAAALDEHQHGGHGEHSGHGEHGGSFLGLEREVLIPLALLLGFMIFMVVEKLASAHSHSHGQSHGHAHSKEDKVGDGASANGAAEDTAESSARRSPRLKQRRAAGVSDSGFPGAKITSTSRASSSSGVPSAPQSLYQTMLTSLRPAGWLNLLADSMHNFTDGVAIGASFAAGRGLGFATFLSVIFHEIPHEIGDFTVLVQSGLTKWQAIQAQFCTALAAIVGVSVGLLADRSQAAEELLLAVTAGGFLYLSTVNMLPQVVQSKASLLQTTLETGSFALGIFMMVLVLAFE